MGHRSHTTTNIVNEKRVDDILNEMKTGANIDNSQGTHNIDVNNVGRNANIFMQNL